MLHLTSTLPCTDTYTHGRGRKHSGFGTPCCLTLVRVMWRNRYVAFGLEPFPLAEWRLRQTLLYPRTYQYLKYMR
jgi:hypothetical protein